jgi:isoleucyl-tRNA synthetase
MKPEANGMDLAYWDKVIEVRDAVNKELEALRVAGEIGANLQAEVELYCGSEIFSVLKRLGDELRFVFITSGAQIYQAGEPPGEAKHVTLSTRDEIWVAVSGSEHTKCVRCWHYREDVGSNSTHPELCGRCVENVDGAGEERRFA